MYVPDELWERVKEAFPARGASDLVQAALREFLERRDGMLEFARDRPAPDPAGVERIRKRLVAEAREAYERGYAEGLRVGEHLEWWMLDDLARRGWDVARWMRAVTIPTRASDGETVFTPLLVAAGLEELPLDDTSFGLGFTHALRDLWESVVSREGRG